MKILPIKATLDGTCSLCIFWSITVLYAGDATRVPDLPLGKNWGVELSGDRTNVRQLTVLGALSKCGVGGNGEKTSWGDKNFDDRTAYRVDQIFSQNKQKIRSWL